MPQRKAIFLDRDGTVIPDHGYLAEVAGVTLLPGAGEALRRLAAAGFLLVLVTNQSGIGRGYFTRETVAAQHGRLCNLLRPFGVTFAGIEVCPHQPTDDCTCRKPRPGMLKRAAAALDVNLFQSFMIGDKPADIIAGRAAGCRTICLGALCADAADHCSATLAEAAAWILRQQEAQFSDYV